MNRAIGNIDASRLVDDIRRWGAELGFQQIGISDINLEQAEHRLNEWLGKGFHGEMGYMAVHGSKRSRPSLLVNNTASVITARMDYLPEETASPEALLDHPSRAYISRYALGRDYHKVLRSRLKRLAANIENAVGPFGHRVFVDSAPVLEKPLAEKSGLGWIGKHTNLINREAGSWFFLGEVYVDIPLPGDQAEISHCGTCRACLDVCPTDAIIAPYELDARRCISYLTIEHRGPIPEELRPLMGNRVFGCDICQEVCPWNERFAAESMEAGYAARGPGERPIGVEALPAEDVSAETHPGTRAPSLVALMRMTREEWDAFSRGSAIRRVGYAGFKRNVAVAMGNCLAALEGDPPEDEVAALREALEGGSELVQEHAAWALGRAKT